tara:strand:+ start:6077 stop:6280 length:204 start_codon:yes stop_codon:yes gene_type:complete
MIKKSTQQFKPLDYSNIIVKKFNDNEIYLCSFFDNSYDYLVGTQAGRVETNVFLEDIEWWIYTNELI